MFCDKFPEGRRELTIPGIYIRFLWPNHLILRTLFFSFPLFRRLSPHPSDSPARDQEHGSQGERRAAQQEDQRPAGPRPQPGVDQEADQDRQPRHSDGQAAGREGDQAGAFYGLGRAIMRIIIVHQISAFPVNKLF